MTAVPAYARNGELFSGFYALQNDFVGRLAACPGLIRRWLEAQPRRQGEPGESAQASRAWRTARLSIARWRELSDLILRAEENPTATASLATWLLTAMPVGTYLEIAESAHPDLGAMDAPAEELCRQLTKLRETLFLTNYGLAKSAARQRNRRDPTELLGAASCGLLDAIDRYVPDARAARFGYFASYWIRYHLSRYLQKCGSVVSFPINQHRIGYRIDRYLAGRRASGLPAPSDAELCADLQLGADAFYWHQLKPRVVSIENGNGPESETRAMEHYICDPAPGPATALEETEIADQLVSLLRASAAPATRVMLAYNRQVGSLPAAAEDYLTHLHELARNRVRR